MWASMPRVIIRKLPSKELRFLVAKLSPFTKFINIYVKMYTLIVQLPYMPAKRCPKTYSKKYTCKNSPSKDENVLILTENSEYCDQRML